MGISYGLVIDDIVVDRQFPIKIVFVESFISFRLAQNPIECERSTGFDNFTCLVPKYKYKHIITLHARLESEKAHDQIIDLFFPTISFIVTVNSSAISTL